MNNPKRVLIFALTYYHKFVGGDGVAVKEITDRISEKDVIFDMITLRLDSNQSKFEKIGNVNVYRVGFSKKNPTPEELLKFPMYLIKVLFPISAFFKALQLNMKNRYDLVWCMMAYAGFPAVLFNLFKPKIPILLTLQDGDPIEKIIGRNRIKIVMPIFKRIFKISKHIQSISFYLQDFAKKMGYTGEMSVIPNGVDYEKFSKSNKIIQKNPDEFWMFTASRLVEKNANDIVIRALAKLPEKVKFIIAGIGPDKKKLEELSKELKVSGRVVFLGHISHDELPNYLHVSDVFIRPSRTEGFGNSFVEAMASGLPVIATTAGGIKDFLINEENGLEVRVENVDDVVNQVNRLIIDEYLRQKIIRNAKEMVESKYDWKIISDKMYQLFKHLTN